MQLLRKRLAKSLSQGAVAGILCIYIALTGMMEAFGEREIVTGVLDLGKVVLLGPFAGLGLLLLQQAPNRRVGWMRVLAACLAGIAATGLFILFIDAVSIRHMFTHASPALVAYMTMGQEAPAAGLGLFAVAALAAGAVGAGLALMPAYWRNTIFMAVLLVVGMALLSELISQVLRQILNGRPDRLLFSQGALRPAVAAIAAAAVFAWRGLVPRIRLRVRDRLPQLEPERQRQVSLAVRGAGVLLLLVLPWLVGSYLSEVLANVGLYLLMALGLNIAVGLAGLFDLGYVTNFAVGAYLMGVLTNSGPQATGEFNFWLVLPVSILAAMFTGLLLALPVIRMRGDYLAIATMGFGEIIRLLALSDWLSPLIGGSQGILFIPKPNIGAFTFQTPQHLFYIILAASLVMLVVINRLDLSLTGRRWMAIRDDETVANAIGIDTTWIKTLAFTLSAASGGLAGAIFASKLGTIFPHSFSLLISMNVLCIIIVGGMGSIRGMVLGTLVLIGVPELLREFAEFRFLLYGILLMAVAIYRPGGLMPARARHYRTEPAPQPAGGTPATSSSAASG
ncbi:MAG: branched-chain amino acid ABC transporter permease [Caldilineaceae bacterium]|nr:branched-chain amino acid ABC transporter permease [Caldilineaceae bacterium]